MRRRRREPGFGLVGAIFLLVVLASVAALMVSVTGAQRRTSALALQAARAYHAARSGIEWGAWQALDTGSCPADSSFSAAEGGLLGFQVSVSCTSSSHVEDGATATVFRIVSIAEFGSFGDADYVRRRLRVTVTGAP